MVRRKRRHTVGAHTYDHYEAPLVTKPTPITRRALEHIGAGTLYTLLHLETLTADDLPSIQRSSATNNLRGIEAEYRRWCDLETHMRAAIATAGGIPRISEHGLRVTYPDREQVLIPMLGVFAIFASAAEHIAKGFVEVDLGDLGPFPGQLATARRMAGLPRSRRKQFTNTSVRARLTALLGALDHWPPGDIAELIVASQRDWNPAPFRLAPRYSFDPLDLESRDRLVAGRARQRRSALLQWIRDQLKAIERSDGKISRQPRRQREK